MKKILLLITIAASIACKKTTNNTTVTPPSTTDTIVQFGTPFNKVPNREDAIIYQVNMRAFSSAGNFQGVTNRLDSIQALGVNVIYLMPIFPIGTAKSINSPYCIKDYQSVNPELGSLADLRNLVEQAHNRNMSVIIDWVANHTSWDHGWITKNKNWYLQDGSGNVVSPPGTGWNDVAQLNFANADMRLAMINSMKFWIRSANIDGFRCDYADGPPVEFWKQAIDSLRGFTSHKLLMLAEGNRNLHFWAGFDYNFGFSFYGTIKSVFQNNTSAVQLNAVHNNEYSGAAATQQVVRYITNHDVNSSDGVPQVLFGNNEGALAAFTIAATMNSVPMIYNGQEIAFSSRISFPFTSVKINWDGNRNILEAYKKILAIRNSEAALRKGSLSIFSSENVCVFTRNTTTDTVLVMANVRNTVINVTLPVAFNNIAATNLLSNEKIDLKTNISLQPYQYLILKK
ncbi:MAG: alpha-amylase family glycosyl hydrolase [Chitinophagaceae bacterium]